MAPEVVMVPVLVTLTLPVLDVLLMPVIVSGAAVFTSAIPPVAPAPLLVPLKLPTVLAFVKV